MFENDHENAGIILTFGIVGWTLAATQDLLIRRDSHAWGAHEIRTRQEWAEQRARILENMQKVMGPRCAAAGPQSPEMLVPSRKQLSPMPFGRKLRIFQKMGTASRLTSSFLLVTPVS